MKTIQKGRVVIMEVLTMLVLCYSNVLATEKIFVAERIGSPVYVIDAKNFNLINTIQPETTTAKMFAAYKDKIYFIDSWQIDVVNNDLTVKDSIEYDGHPTPGTGKAVITPDGKKIYIGVIGWGKEETMGVYVIDLINKKQIKILEEKKLGRGFIHLSPDGKQLYIPESNAVVVVKVADEKIYKRIKVDGFVNEAISNDNNNIYAAVDKSDTVSAIGIINIHSGVSRTIPLPGKVYKIDILPGNYLYALCHGGFVKINLTKSNIEEVIKVDGSNFQPAKDGKLLFITGGLNNKFSVFDVEKKEIIKSLNIGDDPYEVLVK